MSNPSHIPEPSKQHLRLRYPQAFDWVSMAVYVLLVFAWGLHAYPLGRDYLQQEPSAVLSPVWTVLQAAAGSAFWPYQAFNILILYGCMLAIFYLTKLVFDGPWWLGTLAAVLFMANPVHTESVMNLCGSLDLIPCLLALLALNAYCLLVLSGKPAWLLLVAPGYVLAALAAPENIGLIVVFVLLEATLATDTPVRRALRLSALLPPALMAAWLHRHALAGHGGDVREMFAPLYFIFYPIGFLPETVERFSRNPWLGWLAAATVLAALLAICRKAKRPKIAALFLALPAVRLFGGGRELDPVHLVGGGQLLLASALFAIALTALFHRIMDHPKWRRIVVAGTTFLCLIAMIIQVHAVVQWRAAGKHLSSFHAQIRDALEADAMANETLLVAPNLRYLNGAPLCLATSLVFDARAIPFRPELPNLQGRVIALPALDVFRPQQVRMRVILDEDRVAVVVEGADLPEILPTKAPQRDYIEKVGETTFRLDVPITHAERHLTIIPGEFPWPNSDS